MLRLLSRIVLIYIQVLHVVEVAHQRIGRHYVRLRIPLQEIIAVVALFWVVGVNGPHHMLLEPGRFVHVLLLMVFAFTCLVRQGSVLIALKRLPLYLHLIGVAAAASHFFVSYNVFLLDLK